MGSSMRKSDTKSVFIIVLLSLGLIITPSTAAVKKIMPYSTTTSVQNTPEPSDAPHGNSSVIEQKVLTICTSHKTGYQFISKTGKCNIRIYESRDWYLKGTALLGTPGSTTLNLATCISKTSEAQIIRTRSTCNTKTSRTAFWQRPFGPSLAPSISSVSMGLLGTATLNISPPTNDGGSRITSYLVTSTPDEIKGTYSPIQIKAAKITGLNPGKTYTFNVVATNSKGASPPSTASTPAFTPTMPKAPSITQVVATGGNTAQLSFVAPLDHGGSLVTSYVATSIPGGLQTTVHQSSGGTINITNLSYSTTYTFSLTAINVAGSSLASAISTSITTATSPPPPEPVAPAPPPSPRPVAPAPSAPTDTVISAPAIAGVTAPVIGATPVSTTTAGTGYTGTVTWSGSPATFASATTYTATITLTPAAGYTLSGVSANFFTVAGATSVTHSANSGVITAVFPATALLAQSITFTDLADITYGTSPASLSATSTAGLTVVFTSATSSICTLSGTTLTILSAGTCTINANQAGDANYGAASPVTHSFTIARATPSLSSFANLSKTVEDASFTLSAPTVADSLAGAFTYTSATTATATISGATITLGSAGTTLITATFTPTDTINYTNATIQMTLTVIAPTISAPAIAGVTAPVTGATPVSTTTAGTGYTGTVTWSGSPATFASATTYTATITLTPAAGYTLSGVSANFFSVAGAKDVTHTANSGVITGTFYMVGSIGPGGGKIYYFYALGFKCGAAYSSTGSPSGALCHYLEVAQRTWSNTSGDANHVWGDLKNVPAIADRYLQEADNTVSGLGLGYKNSLAIAETYSSQSAADLALAFRGGSKSDWYLPSSAELNELRKWASGSVAQPLLGTQAVSGSVNSQNNIPNNGFTSEFEFTISYYWSSSEWNFDSAWYQRFEYAGNGAKQYEDVKSIALYVRPVRSF